MKTEELKALVAKATPGPWTRSDQCHTWTETYGWPVGPEGNRIAIVANSSHVRETVLMADAVLMSSAPDLAREVLALRQRVEAAKKMAEALETMSSRKTYEALKAWRATGERGDGIHSDNWRSHHII